MKNLSEAKRSTGICDSDPCSVLGPYPASVVAVMADLGLTDHEIAGYFRLQPERITRLRLGGLP